MLLLDWLIQKYPTAKRTTLRQMVESRRVLINGRPATRIKDCIEPTDAVQVLNSNFQSQIPNLKRPPFEILHEDADLIVVLKPPGLLTSTTKQESRATVAQKLEDYLAATDPKSRVGVIHRLDRDASGLLVFSKNTAAYHHLKSQFFHHTVERVYTAIVEGVPQPPTGIIKSRLIELASGKVVPTHNPSEGKVAITNYQTLQTARIKLPGSVKSRTVSLLRITLQTGRKHQIRAHFAAKKTPIVGDKLYGSEKQPPTRLLLAATVLAFDHPRTDTHLRFEIKPPKEITSLLAPAK